MRLESGTAIGMLRARLRAQSNCRFVEPEEYRSLLVSSQELTRADDPEAGVRGLLDRESGIRFLTEEERLFPREEATAVALTF